MPSITLKNRFLLVAALLIGLLVLVDIFALARLRYQSSTTAELSSVWLPIISKTSELSMNVATHRRLEYKLLTNISQEQDAALRALQANKANITIYNRVLEPLLKDSGLRQNFKMYKSSWNDYSKLSEKYLTAIANKELGSAERILKDSRFLFDATEASLKELNDQSYMSSLKIAQDIKVNFQQTFLILILFGLSSLIFGLTMTFWHVQRFHRALTATSSQIGKSSGFIAMNSQELANSSSQILQNSSATIAKLAEVSSQISSIKECGQQTKFKVESALKMTNESLALSHSHQTPESAFNSLKDKTDLSKKCLLQIAEGTTSFVNKIDQLKSDLVPIERNLQDNISFMRKVNISSEILTQDSKELRTVLLELHKMIGKGLEDPSKNESNRQFHT